MRRRPTEAAAASDLRSHPFADHHGPLRIDRRSDRGSGELAHCIDRIGGYCRTPQDRNAHGEGKEVWQPAAG